MYTINTTFIVEPANHTQWYDFVTTKFIPHIKENHTKTVSLHRLLSDQQVDHYTYSFQIATENLAILDTLQNQILTEYATTFAHMFQSDALFFTTVLKTIEL